MQLKEKIPSNKTQFSSIVKSSQVFARDSLSLLIEWHV